MRKGHVSYWPAYAGGERKRVLALFNGKRFLLLSGEVVEVPTYATFKQVMIEHHLDAYCNSVIADFPWLEEAMQDPAATLQATSTGGLVGVTIAGETPGTRQYTARLGQAKVWGEAERATFAFLERLDQAFKAGGVGAHASPASFGLALWEKQRREAGLSPVSRPAVNCRRDLLDHLIGGRADTPGLGLEYPEATEEDIHNAYGFCAGEVPAGAALGVSAIGGQIIRRSPDIATYFCHCKVVIEQPLTSRFGPFPVRLPNGRVSYPTQPGTYTAWLWKEEVLETERAGAEVTVYDGWAWRALTRENRGWIDHLTALRDSAAPEVAALFKQAIVAPIGWHLRQPRKWHLTARGDPATDKPVSGPSGATDWWLHAEEEPDSPALTHWAAYILMRCRLYLYLRIAEHEAVGNEVVLTNFDSVIIVEHTRLPAAERGTPVPAGTWRRQRLTRLKITAARSYTSDQKTRLPGLDKKKRLIA